MGSPYDYESKMGPVGKFVMFLFRTVAVVTVLGIIYYALVG